LNKKHKKWKKDQHRPQGDEPPADHGEVQESMVYTVKIQPDPNDETRHTEQSTHQKQQIQAIKRSNLISGIAAGIAGATLVSLIIYACITYGQLNEARKSNIISRESLTSVQRAFIGFVKFTEERSQGLGGHIWRISAMVENSGTTPAVPVINYVKTARLPSEPDEIRFRGNDTHFPSTSIGPKAVQGLSQIRETENFIMGEELGDLSHPSPKFDPALFVWGWVAYRDIFETPHVTEFCAKMIDAGISKYPPIVQPNWKQCEDHNCIDNYCPDFQTLVALMPLPKK